MDVLVVPGQMLALDITERLHRLHRGKRGWFHDGSLLAQFPLSQAVLLPEDTQESPVAERHVVVGQAHLQAPDKSARGILDQVRQPIVWNSLAPVVKDCPGFF
ncbi:hypothetical protein G6F59_018222 [Rhizopus arrhizus]|nr:hypothetical protein G6F59_018222 [Rhizopus arrhizus]